MAPKKRIDEYESKDLRKHVLDRPGMWIGDVEAAESLEYVAIRSHGEYRIRKQQVTVSAALLRIFIEALSNAIDNVKESEEAGTPCTKIKININEDTGETSVWNDGRVIPIEKKDGIYLHSMLFGQMLTSSNYNDTKDRTVSGTNGVGVKAVNIMSTMFTVEGADPETMQTLKQTWVSNMGTTKGPVIKKSNAKALKGFTKVTWFPDFERFELGGYTKDIVSQYTRYIIDAAMLTGKVAVYLNDERIGVKCLKDYAAMYETPMDIDGEIIEICNTPETQVVITPSTGSETVSFVNGVYTKDGGQHVDAWSEALLRPLVNKLNKRFDAENKEREKKGEKSKVGLNIGDVKQYFRIFVVVTVIRPVFNSQDKHLLVKPKAKDIPTQPLKTAQVNAICKWSVMTFVNAILDAKEISLVNKSTHKKRGFTAIEHLTPANKAGTKDSGKCTLILCEGLSAENYCKTALKLNTDIDGVCGSDWLGIYPLRGKIMNTQEGSLLKTSKNKVLASIVQAMKLDYEGDYDNDACFKSLNYGKVMIMTDADKDGIHIRGLVINFFLTTFPSLCKRHNYSFLTSMETPIVRIVRPKLPDLLIFDEYRKEQFEAENDPTSYKMKYYKGLASSRSEDVAETFNQKRIEYECDDKAELTMQKCFHPDMSDYRKKWIDNYVPGQGQSLDDAGSAVKLSYTDFCNDVYVTHSVYNAKRMIPHLMDGLVPSRRKVLFSVKKKGLTYGGQSFKVERLGSYVAEQSAYHHGEGNLTGVITGMANDYIGGNNIPLLDRDGLFGTRNHGGKDAGQGRYIFTKLDQLTQFIFRKEDDPILNYLKDEGQSIEPEFYVPIIPMALVNGCEGIATGWSCSIPMYNPLDLVQAVRLWIETEGEVIDDEGESSFEELTPWYREFKGSITFDTKHEKGKPRYITEGVCERLTDSRVRVTELPIGMWTETFKKWTDAKREGDANTRVIGRVTQQVSDRDVYFEIDELPDGMRCSVKSMKLTSHLHVSNMSLWGTDHNIRKYPDIHLIIDEFCRVRYDHYVKRKRHQLSTLTVDLTVMLNKKRYITERLNKTLIIEKRPLSDVVDEMIACGYHQKGGSSDECRGYSYLLDMGDRQRTSEKISALDKEISSTEKRIKVIKKTSEFKMWEQELDEFVDHYNPWVVKQRKLYAKGTEPKVDKRRKKK